MRPVIQYYQNNYLEINYWSSKRKIRESIFFSRSNYPYSLFRFNRIRPWKQFHPFFFSSQYRLAHLDSNLSFPLTFCASYLLHCVWGWFTVSLIAVFLHPDFFLSLPIFLPTNCFLAMSGINNQFRVTISAIHYKLGSVSTTMPVYYCSKTSPPSKCSRRRQTLFCRLIYHAYVFFFTPDWMLITKGTEYMNGLLQPVNNSMRQTLAKTRRYV